MTEDPQDAPNAEDAAPLAGRRLAEARRLREVSIPDIAKELHLDEPKVRALEQNQFDILGAPVFVKGYLRKYAELVGVSPEDVLADYHRLRQDDETPPIVGLRRKPPRDISPGPWLAGILVVAVVTGGAWAWLSGGLDPIFSSREPVTLAPFAADEATEEGTPDAPLPEAAGEAEETTAAESEASASPATAVEAPMPAEQTPAMLGAPEPAPPAEGQVTLGLTFSGDCWTEVSDAEGDRLYFGLGKAGGTVSVTGTAPLHVLLGDSENAAVTINGEAYRIPPSARRGDTARLTVTSR